MLLGIIYYIITFDSLITSVGYINVNKKNKKTRCHGIDFWVLFRFVLKDVLVLKYFLNNWWVHSMWTCFQFSYLIIVWDINTKSWYGVFAIFRLGIKTMIWLYSIYFFLKIL